MPSPVIQWCGTSRLIGEGHGSRGLYYLRLDCQCLV